MNITELARRLKIPTEQLKDELPRLGFDIGRRAIKIDDVVAEKVIKLWSERKSGPEQSKYLVVEKKLGQAQVASRGDKVVEIPSVITPREFAALLGLPVTNIISELFKNGVMASINERIDFETASIMAQDLGFTTVAAKENNNEDKEIEQSAKLGELLKETTEAKLETRAPVVVVMGHVDHGKTTLLDTIRSTNIAAGESGAITQHIGAYQVEDNGRKITFLDTPGHEAFAAMRSRGGRLADVAIIVVAADDGLQPQTLEAIEIAQHENLPFLIAINKVDRETADTERVKKSLAEINLLPEDWGGKTICVPISAKKAMGIKELLDMVLLLADMAKLEANPNRLAAGTVIESRLDKGEGPVATVLVQAGTLHIGDYIIIGQTAGKVKSMRDFRGVIVKEALPAMPVRISGLRDVPQAGDIFKVVEAEDEIKDMLRKTSRYQRPANLVTSASVNSANGDEVNSSQICLNVILKTDVLGSREAILASLGQLANSDVAVKIIKVSLGSINESDITQAEVNQAIILGFNVPVLPAAEGLARNKNIFVKSYKVIYDLLDEVKARLSSLLKPELVRTQLGEVEVLKIFRQGKRDMIVGCRVKQGVIRGNTKVHVIRKGEIIIDLNLSEIRIGKEIVGEVAEGGECGIKLLGNPIVLEHDVLEVFHEEIKTRTIA